MSTITAAMVKSLRDRTQLPMMKCKEALTKTDGNEEAAIDMLRKDGTKFLESRGDRETAFGRFGIHIDFEGSKAAMVEVQCESAPVTANDEFRQFVNDMAEQLATGPGAATSEELLSQPSPSASGLTLQDQFNDLTNKIREVFRVPRLIRIDAPCGGYAHHTGSCGVLVEVEGGTQEAARDIAMHVAAMNPEALSIDDLDAAVVAKEREILTEAALREGKPENIVAKMIEGRLKNFFAQRVLLEQPFVKEESMTVGKAAADAGMTVKAFHNWALGQA